MSHNKESDPLVSVVIPTYERPEYLEGAIKTAVGQTYENIEVIVVDDGSTELYAKDLTSQFPETVVCIRHDKNRGLSAARNTGIQNSNGKYVAFLDDDDRWHKTKIARQVSALNSNKNAGLATCFVVALTPDNKIVHCETNAPSGDCSESMLIGNQIGTPSCVLVRKECFDDIGTFDESLPTKQDWDFYLRLCQKWNVTAVDDYLCFRTIHESMSSSTQDLKRDKNAILEKHGSLIRDAGVWNQAQASVDEEIGRSFLDNNELERARRFLRHSLSEVNARRIALWFLSYTHPLIVHSSIRLKRTIARRKSDCAEVSITSADIPGL